MNKAFVPLVTCLALACQAALAQPAPANDALREATQRAIATNPEVTSRLNAYKAAADEVDIARSGFLPRVDLSANAGRVRDRYNSRTPQDQTLSTTGVALSASQLLWDGLGTRNLVQQSGHARLTRYFEFLDASDQTALAAVQSWIDVARARALVRLAEDNYVQHRQVVDLIQSRVKAGVSRGVDLEQAAARLALAEANLNTETANLHDMTERYQRVVGAPPPGAITLPSLEAGLAASPASMLEGATRRNAAIAAAVENYRAAEAQARNREAAYQPRVEAQVRAGSGHNFDGLPDQKRDATASLVLNWNLFAGGADRARVRQAANLLNQAADLRDKACRDTRQTAAIAFNDTRKLVDQIAFLDRNTLAAEKARDAYRQQFDIGQRTLLDVLNAENEVYTARRSLANAEHDLVLARARSHAATTNLVSVLGLTRAGQDDTDDVRNWAAAEDAASRCPLTATALPLTSKADLDARARNAVTPNQTSLSGLPAAAPTAPAATLPATAPPTAPAAVSVSQRLLDWSQAWQDKDAAAYAAFYDPSFKPENGTRAQWLANRAVLLRKEGPITVKLSNVQRKTLSPTLVETSFDLAYSATDLQDNVRKTLTWKRSGGTWTIVREVSR
jgi:adhesin transport system outer membrane protein